MPDSLAEVEFDRQSDGEAFGDRPHQQSSAWACTGAPAGMPPLGWDPTVAANLVRSESGASVLVRMP